MTQSREADYGSLATLSVGVGEWRAAVTAPCVNNRAATGPEPSKHVPPAEHGEGGHPGGRS